MPCDWFLKAKAFTWSNLSRLSSVTFSWFVRHKSSVKLCIICDIQLLSALSVSTRTWHLYIIRSRIWSPSNYRLRAAFFMGCVENVSSVIMHLRKPIRYHLLSFTRRLIRGVMGARPSHQFPHDAFQVVRTLWQTVFREFLRHFLCHSDWRLEKMCIVSFVSSLRQNVSPKSLRKAILLRRYFPTFELTATKSFSNGTVSWHQQT